jgi:shikimate dehydrogenase
MKFGLLGEKLGHSYSPLIHTKVFEYINVDATYELIELKSDMLDEQINKLKTGEYQGYNVTIPYKKEVIKYLDYQDRVSYDVGSVNTIARERGRLVGFNTDVFGMEFALNLAKITIFW